MPLALAGLLTLGAILAIPAEATHNAFTAPYPAIDMGVRSSAHQAGSLISIVSSNNAGTLVYLTYSTDGGSTWTNRNTGINAGNSRLEVIGYTGGTFEFFYMSGSTLTGYRSTDSGVTWLLVYQDNAGNFNSNAAGFYDFQDLGGGKFAYLFGQGTTNCGSSCAQTGGFGIRYYNGVQFSTIFSQTYGSCIGFNGATHSPQSASFWITTLAGTAITGARVAYASTHAGACSSTGGLPVTRLMTNGAWGTEYQLDDATAPLSARTYPVSVLPGDVGTLFGAGSPSKLFYAVPATASTFTAIPTFVFSSQFLDASVAGSRYSILTAEDANVPIASWTSCDAGATWGRHVLESFGTHPATPDLLPVAGATFLYTFRYGGSLGYFTNDDVTCPGNGIPLLGNGGTGSTTALFDQVPLFCSARSETRFGYNYAEDVSMWDTNSNNEVAFTIDHGFMFNGDTDDYAYLAAALVPSSATTAMRAYFKIESAVSAEDYNENHIPAPGGESVFRVGFSFRNHVTEGWQVPDDADAPLTTDAKGDGGDPGSLPSSGIFYDYIEARFEEEGDDWEVRVFLYWNGARVQLGPVVYIDDPDEGTMYAFEVDTSQGNPYYWVRHVNNVDFTPVTIKPEAGAPMEKPLTAVAHPNRDATLFTDAKLWNEKIYSSWFTGHSTTAENAWTILDNGKKDPSNAARTLNPSTCIYDPYQLAVKAGSPGATGPLASATGAVQTATFTGSVTQSPGLGAGGFGGGSLIPPPSDAQIALFGSERAVQAFRGLIMFVAGVGVGSLGILAASAALANATNNRVKVPLGAIIGGGMGCGMLALVMGLIFGIVELWFLGFAIVILLAVLVLMVVRALGGGSTTS